jgi:hypothetical protein
MSNSNSAYAVLHLARASTLMSPEIVMLHAVRVRPVKLLSMTIAALGILVATSVSFAIRPPVPQTRIADERPDHVASPIDIVADVTVSGGPSAFGFLEFDWAGPGAVPGFGPWRNEAASVSAAEIVQTR